jgi:hypothetical protein
MVGLAMLTLILAGCTETKTVYVVGPDFEAPAAPRGVTSTTGDEQVWVDWLANGESDLAGYKVWRASEANGIAGGPYSHIATVGAGTTTFIDQNVANGVTYFYAVSAFDDVGNESPLSPEDVYDTPRPEGSSYMRDFNVAPGSAGFDFFNTSPYGVRTSWTDVDADVYLEYVPGDGAWFINVTDIYTDIQDMGYTSSFDEISYAPEAGWSEAGWVEAIEGHTYVVWTFDFHYAKIRITSIDQLNSTVYFDWGYQTSDGNLGNGELKPAVGKPQHDPATYLRRPIAR